MALEDSQQQTDEESLEAVLAEHPEVRELFAWLDRVEIGGVNPCFHVMLEAIVENQIRQDDPPEVKEAVSRLQAMGFRRHAAIGNVAHLFTQHLFPVLKDRTPFDHELYVRQLRLLGSAELSKVGRDDPCPCGSGKKFKKCCLPIADGIVADPRAGTLLLGWGSYTLDPDAVYADPQLAQMENRAAIAEFMEEQGCPDLALRYLLENVSCAEARGERGLLVNALEDVQRFCLDHPEYAELGLETTDRLILLAEGKWEKAALRRDRAVMTTARRRMRHRKVRRK